MRIIHFERNDETFSLGVAVGEGLSFRFAVANATDERNGGPAHEIRVLAVLNLDPVIL